jgi:hypothetical protein
MCRPPSRSTPKSLLVQQPWQECDDGTVVADEPPIVPHQAMEHADDMQEGRQRPGQDGLQAITIDDEWLTNNIDDEAVAPPWTCEPITVGHRDPKVIVVLHMSMKLWVEPESRSVINNVLLISTRTFIVVLERS